MAEFVRGACVRRVLRDALKGGMEPGAIADRAGISERTLWRKLKPPTDSGHDLFDVLEADDLIHAAHGHIDMDCSGDIVEQ